MKNQLETICRIAVVTIAATGLCVTASAAQKANEPAAQKKEAAAKSSPGTKSQDAGASLSAKDKAFMQEAAQGGMMEVDMGKMAQQQGKSADVKKIGSRMVADHSKANAELMALAKKKGVDLSKEKPKMEKMDHANFDKEYVEAMVKDHVKDIAAFEAEAKGGGDPDVKGFASKTLPTLKKHLAMVKEAQGKMK